MSTEQPKVGDPAPRPLVPLSQEELTTNWPVDESGVVVSVLCTAFNHEPYLADALGGVLAQRTTFPFEVIIRDDASSDGTQDIIRRFAAAYPRIVRAVLEPVNRWQSVKPLGAMEPLARGKYFAICEGDDYWIDPLRLQRQVDLLEGNPDAVLAYHDAVSVEHGLVTRASKLMPGTAAGIRGRRLLRGTMAPIPTVMYRNIEPAPVAYERHMLNFDQFLFVRLGRHGHGIPDGTGVGAVHRLHEGSAWFATSDQEQASNLLTSQFWMAAWLASVGERAPAAHFKRSARRTVGRASSGRGQVVRGAAGRLRRWMRRRG